MNQTVVNPYAKYLGKQDPIAIIRSSPARLRQLAQRLGPRGLEKSLAPGKWPARAILCHLADTELAFSFRIRQTLAEPHHVIQPFDQDAWARNYSSLTADAALQTFSAVREWNLALIGSIPEEAFSKPVTHPERGQMTFQVLLDTMAGHDLNHIQQLQTIAGEQ